MRLLEGTAPIFAALGDETRLGLVARLAAGEALSITRLTENSGVTRQAVTRHLEVLAGAGLVQGTRRGREHLWQLEPARLALARRSLDQISRWWDEKLAALIASVEE
ncbi:MAG TPA: metalloregulator ArsR/SmtB family transcription factor [Dehalococcoidia bacterium]|nr:metalloregulator ArsR/SmtB family transcription factor [Dehalococcoidia bacterium]